jgi:hypothetical protein
MSSKIQKTWTSMPDETAAAAGLDPTSPIWASPDAIARITSPPPGILRQLIV